MLRILHLYLLYSESIPAVAISAVIMRTHLFSAVEPKCLILFSHLFFHSSQTVRSHDNWLTERLLIYHLPWSGFSFHPVTQIFGLHFSHPERLFFFWGFQLRSGKGQRSSFSVIFLTLSAKFFKVWIFSFLLSQARPVRITLLLQEWTWCLLTFHCWRSSITPFYHHFLV